MSDDNESDSEERTLRRTKRKVIVKVKFDDTDSSSNSDDFDNDGTRKGNGRKLIRVKKPLTSASGNSDQSDWEPTRNSGVKRKRQQKPYIYDTDGNSSDSSWCPNGADGAVAGPSNRAVNQPSNSANSANSVLSELIQLPEDGSSTDTSSNDGATDKCPICLHSFRNQEIGKPDICDHSFCATCIEEWSKNVQTCPIDRKEFAHILVQDKYEDGKTVRKIKVVAESQPIDISDDLTFCEVCNNSNREDRMLLCDGCNRGYHMDCLTPSLDEIPSSSWYCDLCFASDLSSEEQDDINELIEEMEMEIGVPETRLRVRRADAIPRITRTRQSERIRAAILSRIAPNRRHTSNSISALGVPIPGPSIITTTTTTTTTTSRVKRTNYKKRKTRKRQRRRRTYVVEYDVQSGNDKFAIKTTTQRRVIRRKRRSRKNGRSRRTRRGRIPGRRTGTCSTGDRRNVRTNEIASEQGLSVGPSLHLFDDDNILTYFSDEEHSDILDAMNELRGTSSSILASALTRPRVGSTRTLRRQKNILNAVESNRVQSESADILSNIMNTMDQWHSMSKPNMINKIKIGFDGKLSLERDDGEEKESNQSDAMSTNTNIMNAPMYSRGEGGFNNRFQNSGTEGTGTMRGSNNTGNAVVNSSNTGNTSGNSGGSGLSMSFSLFGPQSSPAPGATGSGGRCISNDSTPRFSTPNQRNRPQFRPRTPFNQHRFPPRNINNNNSNGQGDLYDDIPNASPNMNIRPLLATPSSSPMFSPVRLPARNNNSQIGGQSDDNQSQMSTSGNFQNSSPIRPLITSPSTQQFNQQRNPYRNSTGNIFNEPQNSNQPSNISVVNASSQPLNRPLISQPMSPFNQQRFPSRPSNAQGGLYDDVPSASQPSINSSPIRTLITTQSAPIQSPGTLFPSVFNTPRHMNNQPIRQLTPMQDMRVPPPASFDGSIRPPMSHLHAQPSLATTSIPPPMPIGPVPVPPPSISSMQQPYANMVQSPFPVPPPSMVPYHTHTQQQQQQQQQSYLQQQQPQEPMPIPILGLPFQGPQNLPMQQNFRLDNERPIEVIRTLTPKDLKHQVESQTGKPIVSYPLNLAELKMDESYNPMEPDSSGLVVQGCANNPEQEKSSMDDFTLISAEDIPLPDPVDKIPLTSVLQNLADYGSDDEDDCPNHTLYSAESMEVAKITEATQSSKSSTPVENVAEQIFEKDEDLVQLDDEDDIFDTNLTDEKPDENEINSEDIRTPTEENINEEYTSEKSPIDMEMKTKKNILELYDSDFEEWNNEKNEDQSDINKDNTLIASVPMNENNERVEDERSYTPCLDEQVQVNVIENIHETGNQELNKVAEEDVNMEKVEEPAVANRSGIGGMETEMISDDGDEDILNEPGESGNKPDQSKTNKKLTDKKAILKDGKSKKKGRDNFKKISKSNKDRNYRDKKYDKMKRKRRNRSRSLSKSMSRSISKNRSRSRSRSRSNNKENRGRIFRRNKFRRRDNRRKDMERYDVRNVIAERQPRSYKDKYGRDTSRPAKSRSNSRSISPRRRRSRSLSRRRSLSSRRRSFSPRRRSKSPRRGSASLRRGSASLRRRSISPRRKSISPKRRSISPRRRSITPRRRSISPRRRSGSLRRKSVSARRRSISSRHSRSPSLGRKSLSRGRKRTIRRISTSPVQIARRRTRTPLRNRSKTPLRSHILNGKNQRSAIPSKSPSISSRISKSLSPKRILSKPKRKTKIRKKPLEKKISKRKSKKRQIAPSPTRMEGAKKKAFQEPVEFDPIRPRSKSWSDSRRLSSWSRSPIPDAPVAENVAGNENSWTPPITRQTESEHLTVILKNKETKRKKDKKRRGEKRKELQQKRDRRKQRSGESFDPPAPSKEVFASGDNILVSVSFNKDAANKQQQTTIVTVPASKEQLMSKRQEASNKRSKKGNTTRKRKKVDMKPVAIIDLDRSPFMELPPSPKAVIVLSDSDHEGNSKEPQKRPAIPASDSEANDSNIATRTQDNNNKQASQPQSPTMDEISFEMATMGPKTPPEPQIVKFTLPSKSKNKLRIVGNVLHDINEPDNEPKTTTEEIINENESAQAQSKVGPNTPPESGPCSPDAYDPFEPTKSPSMSPNRGEGGCDSSPNDPVNSLSPNISATVDDKRQQTDKQVKSVDLAMALINSKASMDAAHSLLSSTLEGSVHDDNIPNDDIQLISPKPSEEPQKQSSIQILSNVIIAPSKDNRSSKANQNAAPLTPKQSPLKPTKPISLISKLPLPKTSKPVTSRHNGGNDEIVEFESPYSPDSSDYDDLFEPPPVSPPMAQKKTKVSTTTAPATSKNVASNVKNDLLDELFGNVSPVSKIPPVGFRGGNAAAATAAANSARNRRHKKTAVKGKERIVKNKKLIFNKEWLAVNKRSGYGKLTEGEIKIIDELPSSAVELQVKDKFLRKIHRQERVVEEVKVVLKPHYNKKHITKEDYKDILRRAVPKICHNRTGEINPKKIHALIEAYVRKFRHRRKVTAAGNTNSFM